MTYQEFLAKKTSIHVASGFDPGDLSQYGLFDFQDHVVRWALNRGKAAIFAGTGLGKTRMQVAFADQVHKKIGGRGLILTPLAVAAQTMKEAATMGVEIGRADRAYGDGVFITNYHRLEQIGWDPSFVVLDESSILKSHDGAYRKYIQDRFSRTPYKLALTATPAPNDYMELGTHSEFLTSTSRLEMLATYFMHDGGDTSKWRLKRHARRDFWSWVSGWAMCFNSPADLGYDASRFDLPPMSLDPHIVGEEEGLGGLFGGGEVSATSLHRTLRNSMDDRVGHVADLVNGSDGPFLVWCTGNDEQTALERAIRGAVSVRGSDSIDTKEDRLNAFSDGDARVLITKPSIAGFGMNWQHCNQMVFTSISYSFEQMYQAIRRCYRFGQTRNVHVHVVFSPAEQTVWDSLSMKSEAFRSMHDEMKRFLAA